MYLVNKGQLYAVRVFELMAKEMFRKELAKLKETTRKISLDHTVDHMIVNTWAYYYL